MSSTRTVSIKIDKTTLQKGVIIAIVVVSYAQLGHIYHNGKPPSPTLHRSTSRPVVLNS